jgi:hypothetical protein
LTKIKRLFNIIYLLVIRLETTINESSNFEIISDVSLSKISPRFLNCANLKSILFQSFITDLSLASMSFSFVAAIQTSFEWKKKQFYTLAKS